MNEVKYPLEQALPEIAAEQEAAVASMSHVPEAIAEEAMRRAWKPARRNRLMPYLSVAGVAASVAFVVAFFVARTNRNDLRFEVAGRAGEAGVTLTAQASSPLPLHFSDGSVLTFQPRAQARVARLFDNGAELLLASGRVLADVRHTGQARWTLAAGPFKVRVTGTRFAAEWQPTSGRLAIEMFEGSVIVEGPSLGTGLALTSGQSLDVGVSSPAVLARAPTTEHAPVLAEVAPDTVPSAPAPAAAPAEHPVAAPTRPAPSWSDLASHRRYAEALAAAEREGFLRLCRQLDAVGLLALGDAARYASSPNRARQAYQALVRRFARDQRSQDALFALGRLESESGSPAAAARWFERYLGSAGNPPLAEEAAGRLVELYDRAGDREAATRAARDYLDRHPDGLRAALARRILTAQKPRKAP